VHDGQLSCARGLEQFPCIADDAIESGNRLLNVLSLLLLKVDQEKRGMQGVQR
jgi:hypothetical protein